MSNRILLVALMVIGIVAIGQNAYAVTVIQENLTPEEQAVLDDIAAARADGTYIPLPEAELTANVRVYSEEVSIQVTHPVDLEAIHCYTNFDLFVPTTHCILPGFPPNPDDKYFDTETETWRPVEELILVAKEEQKQLEDEFKTREQLYNEERITYIQQRTNPSELELEELELREQKGALCRNDTEVSQKYREFDVETEIFLNHEGNMEGQLKVDHSIKAESIRDNRYVQDLRKQVQECIGQPFTKKSVQYDHIVVDGLFSADPNKPVAPDAISADMVNDGSNVSEDVDVHDIACASYTTQVTKDLYNCIDPVITYEVTGDTPELGDYTDSDPMKRMNACLENPSICLQESIKYNNKDKHATVYGGNN